MLSPETVLQNRYRVLRQLGRGGMGTVYEAIDDRVPCLVALKETLLQANEEARHAFEREAGLLGNLRHRSLPKVTDHFSENDGLFLVMEYIPGLNLLELMKELGGGPFPIAQVLKWTNTLLEVLEYLHERRPPIVHRDIKPLNLKLTEDSEIYLLDFGLAKGATGEMKTLRSDRSLPYTTPAYASLEQIHHEGTDPRSDLYSLSATIYHLLTGLQPPSAPARSSALVQGHTDPLEPIIEHNSKVPATVASIIHQGMAVSRKDRPGSAREMRQALLEAEEEQRRAAELHRRKEEDKRLREEEERQRLLIAAAVQSAESRRRQEEQERLRMQEAETRRDEEARQQQAEESRRRKAEEAAKRIQAERQRREKEEQQRRDAEAQEAQRHADKATRIGAEEEAARIRAEEDAKRQHAQVPKSIPMPLQPTRPSPKATPTVVPLAPAIETLEAPPPERFVGTLQGSEITTALDGRGTSKQSHYLNGKRIVMVAASLAAILLGTIILWSVRTANRNSSPRAAEPNSGQQSLPDERPNLGTNEPLPNVTPLISPISTTDDLYQIALNADGRMLAATGGNRVRLWRVSELRKAVKLQDKLTAEGANHWLGVAFSPDGQTLACGSLEGILRIWRLSDNSLIKSVTTETGTKNESTKAIFRVGFSTDSQTLFSASSSLDKTEKQIQLWRVSDWSLLGDMSFGPDQTIVAISPDKHIVAATDAQKRLQLWSVENKSALRTLEGYSNEALYGTFSSDGELLALGNEDGTVQLINIKDGRLVHTLTGPKGKVNRVSFSEDKKIVAAGWDGGTIQIWRVSDGSLIKSLSEQNQNVKSLAFSGNARLLAAAYEKRTIRLWQISERHP